MSATAAPPSARTIARFASVVDLPSPATDEVTTRLRNCPSTPTNCRFVRRVRNASAVGPRGSSCAISGCLFALTSAPMPPRTGRSVICSRSARPWTRRSRRPKITARRRPATRPMIAPRARFSGNWGSTGFSGGTAGCSTSTFTGLALPSAVVSSWFTTTLAKLSDTARDSSVASAGVSPRAAISMITEFGSVDAVTWRVRSAAVTSRSRSSMTGVNTRGVVATST